ncbi:YraN family protein [Demequina pelophila]|uniref:YraN family protein n=1 Tax=Demequina pelophila TaxID=1638984 RepID=UPI0007807A46|nr:YraN family protein [Demequina pelophila]
MAVKDAVGRFGEEYAARRLVEQGWTLLDRNWRCEHGEIDLVGLDGGALVVVEVKTRRSEACGGALEAVTPAKVARLRRLAGAWLEAQPRAFPSVRIDVAAVTLPRRGDPSVEFVRDVG